MKMINRFLLRFVLKQEMKRKNQVDAMSNIFFEIQKYMNDNFQHFDTISSHRYPSFLTDKPQTVNDFIDQCFRDGASRFEHEKMGIDSGV